MGVMNRDVWAAIKALHPTPVMFPVGRGQVHKRVKPKTRRPSPVARHLAAQHRPRVALELPPRLVVPVSCVKRAPKVLPWQPLGRRSVARRNPKRRVKQSGDAS